MFKVGEYVIYKHDLCKVKDIKEKYFNNTDYYILESNNDSSLTISVPSNNILLRPLITKEEIDKLIARIPNIDIINNNSRMIENEYKKLLDSCSYDDLISIIKTTYLRNKERLDNNKKIAEKDNYYFEKAELILYSEFSMVLGLSFEETKKYVTDKIKEMLK